MSRGPKLTTAEVADIIGLLSTTLTYRQIERKTGRSQTIIGRIAQRIGAQRKDTPLERVTYAKPRPSQMKDDDGLSAAADAKRVREEIARAESMWPVLLLGERFDEKGRGHRA